MAVKSRLSRAMVSNVILAVCAVAALIVVDQLFKYFKGNSGTPPGPFGVPLLGYAPFIETAIFQSFAKLQKVYGDVFQLNLYGRRFVILNSYDSIKEAADHGEALLDRPHEFNYWNYSLGSLSVGTLSGPSWKLHRKFAMNKIFSMSVVNEIVPRFVEIGHDLVKYMKGTRCEPTDFADAVANSSLNGISLVLISKNFSWDDPQLIQMRNDIRDFFPVIPGLGFMVSGPIYQFLEETIMRKRFKAFTDISQRCVGGTTKIILDRLRTFDPNHPTNDFLSSLLLEHHKEKENSSETKEKREFSIESMSANLFNMFLGGTETTSETLYEAMFFLAQNCDVQEKLQRELDEVVGKRTPLLSDKQNLPYTMAFLEELYRVSNIVPLSLPKLVSQNVDIGGYRVPKDSYILSNYYLAMRNEGVFKSSHAFDPSNFLDDSGKFTRIAANLSFGMGKRNCLGETFARNAVFVWVVMLAQNFWFEPPKDQKLELKVTESLVRTLNAFKVCAVPRELKNGAS